jgi:hypothetical protein
LSAQKSESNAFAGKVESRNSFDRFFPSWVSQALQSFNDEASIILAQIHPACRFATTRFCLRLAWSFRGAKKPILSWVSLPFRGLTNSCAADLRFELLEPKDHQSTTLLSVLCSPAHLTKEALFWRGCQLPQRPTRSVSTLSANRSLRPLLSPFGFISPRKRS